MPTYHHHPFYLLFIITLPPNKEAPKKKKGDEVSVWEMALSVSPVAVAGLAVVVGLVVLYRRVARRLPPGPRGWPVVGNLFDIKPVRFRCFWEWSQQYGPVMSVWFGGALNVVVSSAEAAREVLKERDGQLADRYRSRSAERFSRGGQDMIWADYGPHYVKVRKLCTLELFSPRRLDALRPIREDEVTAMVESIHRDCSPASDKTGKSLVLREHLEAVAFNNITRLAFGKRFVNAEGITDDQGIEFKSITTNGVKVSASLALPEYIPWLRWLFPLDEEAHAKHQNRRDRLSRVIMEEHTQARKQHGEKQHFVDALLTLREKYELSEDTIIGLLWDMITAGMDTTVITVEWAMAELVRNPKVQEKAQEELDRVVGTDRILSETDFPNLPYLSCIVKEGLRLHPPTPLMLPHRATTSVRIGGYDIPKGSIVHVNVWALGRDPKVWKDPLEFRPERFMEENIDIKGNDFRVLPFGAGRRVCPGAQLGLNLVTSMLGHLLHHYKWSLPEGVKPDEVDMTENPGIITFMHTPLKAVASPRLPAHLYKRVPTDM